MNERERAANACANVWRREQERIDQRRTNALVTVVILVTLEVAIFVGVYLSLRYS